MTGIDPMGDPVWCAHQRLLDAARVAMAELRETGRADAANALSVALYWFGDAAGFPKTVNGW